MDTNDQIIALISSNVILVGAFCGNLILEWRRNVYRNSDREQDRLDREQDRLDMAQIATMTEAQLDSIRTAGSSREQNIISEIRKNKQNGEQ